MWQKLRATEEPTLGQCQEKLYSVSRKSKLKTLSYSLMRLVDFMYNKSTACGCQSSAVAAYRKFYVKQGA